MKIEEPISVNRGFVFAQIGIGLAAAIAIIFLALTIPSLIEQRNQLKAEASALGQEISALAENIEERQRAIQSLRDEELEARQAKEMAEKELADAAAKLELIAARLESNEYDYAKQVASSRSDKASSGAPRVYIHVRKQEQTQLAEMLTAALRSDGVTVPGTEILVDKGPAMSELRYFRQNEKEEAVRIYKALRAAAPDINWRPEPIYVPNYETSTAIRTNHFELWLSADASA